MAAICIGPVCIPYTAFIPFFYYLWVPLLKWLRKTFPGTFGKEKKEKVDEDAFPAKRDKRSKDGDNAAANPPSETVTGGASSGNNDGGGVIVLEDDEEWGPLEAKAQAAGQAIVLCFTATWCGPCQAIAPAFKRLAEEYPGAVFVKVRGL